MDMLYIRPDCDNVLRKIPELDQPAGRKKKLPKYQSWLCYRGGGTDHTDRLTRHTPREGERKRRDTEEKHTQMKE